MERQCFPHRLPSSVPAKRRIRDEDNGRESDDANAIDQPPLRPPVDGPREQDQYMPIANIIRIMRRILPAHAKISDDAKETVQECVSEYIAFITQEANDRCQSEQRKTVTAEDLLYAFSKLGFDQYVGSLTLYLDKYREIETERSSLRGELPSHLRRNTNSGSSNGPPQGQEPNLNIVLNAGFNVNATGSGGLSIGPKVGFNGGATRSGGLSITPNGGFNSGATGLDELSIGLSVGFGGDVIGSGGLSGGASRPGRPSGGATGPGGPGFGFVTQPMYRMLGGAAGAVTDWYNFWSTSSGGVSSSSPSNMSNFDPFSPLK